MAVYPRGATFQANFMVKGQRVRKDGFDSAEAAEKWEAAARKSVLLGKSVDELLGKPSPATGVTSLRQLLDATAQRWWYGTRNEQNSLKNAEDCLTFFGEHSSPNSIDTASVDRLIAHFKSKSLEDSTINRKLAALSKMLKHGSTRGWVDKLPCIERKREPKGRIRWLTADEEKAVLAWCENQEFITLKQLIIVLIDTGIRLGEAMELTWDNVDTYVRIWKNKADHARSVPATTRVLTEIAERKKRCPKDETHVFWDTNHDRVHDTWEKLRKDLKMVDDPHFIPHMLRHTFCSRLVQRNVAIATVQALAGHKSITTTMRYAHLAQSNLEQAIKLLEVA